MPPFFMSDYTRFHHTDFLLDDWFIASVRHPTPETEAFWRAFLAQHPQQAEAVAKARQLVLGSPTYPKPRPRKPTWRRP
jgi:hypothetical protein